MTIVRPSDLVTRFEEANLPALQNLFRGAFIKIENGTRRVVVKNYSESLKFKEVVKKVAKLLNEEKRTLENKAFTSAPSYFDLISNISQWFANAEVDTCNAGYFAKAKLMSKKLFVTTDPLLALWTEAVKDSPFYQDPYDHSQPSNRNFKMVNIDGPDEVLYTKNSGRISLDVQTIH
ncbi:MAG: hypothetical protein JHC93_07235 [Parachlamydiales bacterium]|nr:hypothetical protein [Parachlamydiales bacterium]